MAQFWLGDGLFATLFGARHASHVATTQTAPGTLNQFGTSNGPLAPSATALTFYSAHLKAGTISVICTWSVWAREMADNVALSIRVQLVDAAGGVKSTIVSETANQGGGELPTTAGLVSGSVAMTTTTVATGDHLLIRVYFDDAADQGGTGNLTGTQGGEWWFNGAAGGQGEAKVDVPGADVGPIQLVKHVGTHQDKVTSSPSITVPTGGVPVDDLVLVRYTTDPAVALTNLTCTDSRGNVYTRTGNSQPANGSTIAFFYSKITTALLAGDTISFNSNADEKAISIEQFSGVDAVEDVALAAANSSGGVYSVSSTTASADALLVGVFGITGPTGDTFAGDAPDFVDLTRVGTSGAGAASNTTNNGAYKIVSSAGTYTFNSSGSIRGWQGVLLALKAAVSADPLIQSKTDALGLLDSHTVVLTSARAQTDSLGLLDSITVGAPLSVTITDALGALDSRTQAATYAQTVTDALQILDSVSRVGTLNDTRTDLVSSLDSQTVASTMARGPPDEAIGILDASTKSIGTTVQRPLTQVGIF